MDEAPRPRLSVTFDAGQVRDVRGEAEILAASPTGGKLAGWIVLAVVACGLGLAVWHRLRDLTRADLPLLIACFAVGVIYVGWRSRKSAAGGAVRAEVYDDRLTLSPAAGGSVTTLRLDTFKQLDEGGRAFHLRPRRGAGAGGVVVPKAAMDDSQQHEFRRIVAAGIAAPRAEREESGTLLAEWQPGVGDGLQRVYGSRAALLALPTMIAGMIVFNLAIYYTRDEPAAVSPLAMAGFGIVMGTAFWAVITLVLTFNAWSHTPVGVIRISRAADGGLIIGGPSGETRVAPGDLGPVRRVAGGHRIGSWQTALFVPDRAWVDDAARETFDAP